MYWVLTEIKCAGTGVDSTFIGKCLSWEVVIQDDTIRAKLMNCIALENVMQSTKNKFT